MMSKTFPSNEQLRTILALILQTFVLSCVFFEIFINIETLPANLAIIRELSGVQLHVLLYPSFLCVCARKGHNGQLKVTTLNTCYSQTNMESLFVSLNL